MFFFLFFSTHTSESPQQSVMSMYVVNMVNIIMQGYMVRSKEKLLND